MICALTGSQQGRRLRGLKLPSTLASHPVSYTVWLPAFTLYCLPVLLALFPFPIQYDRDSWDTDQTICQSNVSPQHDLDLGGYEALISALFNVEIFTSAFTMYST